jgi:nitrite reductase/ring-hydroxylating ferredoxin subunit
MLRKTIVGALLLSLALVIVGCSGPTSNPTPPGPIEATWIEPQVAGDTVSIPVSEVENNWNVHFRVETEDNSMNFMAYLVDGEIYVRANVCPPCQSIGFSLEDVVLICDRCATTFEAETGEGIEGACVDFPKASVPYQINGGNIIMSSTDLIVAYEDTIDPGWP